MTEETEIVFVVDDDLSVRQSLESLLRSTGLRVETFATARQFLSSHRPDVPGCLVLDVRLPGQSGLDLQQKMNETQITIPIIFITGHGDIPMSVRAMKAGAVEFLTKPFRDEELLNAVRQAIERDRLMKPEQAERAQLVERFKSLTPRECEIMELVTAGLLNKQIAYMLGISEITVKVHRAHVMQKMQAQSLAELVKMSEKINFET
jgi:FixJ family two-component response regulator